MEATVLNKEQTTPKFREDPLLSFVVPTYNIRPDILRRCLRSLDTQDYDNMEIICVLDGPNEELRKVAEAFAANSPKKYTVVEIPHSGAPAARNAGFEKSKGEVVSFFCSDYILNPGAARLWIDKLLAHPECGFVYGGYEYATTTKSWYTSKKFDVDELDVANYIDSAFPLWRKYVVPWDTNFKSLQDWDFWLSVIKTHKIQGYYLGRDITFIAEAPRPGGLSFDSHAHWHERVKSVKQKHGIPIRDILVTSIGAPYHGRQIAKVIDADFRDDTWHKENEYKALYLIGFYMRPDQLKNDHPHIISHYKDKGAKIVVHFVGADIYWLRKFPWESLQYLAGALKRSCDHILCENEQAQRELKEFGIPAEIVPIPPYNDYEVKPLPENFSVAIFLTTTSDFDKYCYEQTLSIVRAMPDVRFVAYGDGGQDIRYPNLLHVGNLSKEKWKEFVYANSCYIRLVRHDTRPMASDEFILAGRDVITNIPFPHMNYIDTRGNSDLNEWDIFGSGFSAERWPKTKKAIIQTIRRLARKENAPTLEDRKMWHDEYEKVLDRQTYVNKIKELCNG